MDTPKNKSYKSVYTTVRSVRITHTQNALLNREQRFGRASAIVRALLTLYFNKQIPNVEALVTKELDIAKQAELERINRSRRKIA